MHYKNLLLVIISIAMVITASVVFSCKNNQPADKSSTTDNTKKKSTNDTFRVRPLTNVKFEPTAQRLKLGGYLANGILQCFTCHSPRNWDLPGAPPLEDRKGSGGTIINEDSTMRIIAPNITPDKETGAGTWTDDMLARAIREGAGHDGRALNWRMPHFVFRNLSDEELAAVIVYLRSLAPVHNVVPPTKMSAEEKAGMEKSIAPITSPVLAVDQSDSIKRGMYLVRIGECVGCHTSHAACNPGINGGGNDISRFGIRAFSANITADASGIPYGPQNFIFAIRTGKGGTLSPIMPWVAYRNMTDEDLRAMYAYLRTLPPARHVVSSQLPFTHCAICGMDHGLGEKNKREMPAGITIDPALYNNYTGTYFNEERQSTYIIFKEGNKLFGKQWETAPKIELIPQSASYFLAPGWPVPVSFIKDKDGHIAQLMEATDYGVLHKKIK